MQLKVGILGSGTWGVGIAYHLAHKKVSNIHLYGRNKIFTEILSQNRRYSKLNIDLPDTVQVSSNLARCIQNVDILISAIPSIAVDSLWSSIADIGFFNKVPYVVNVSKGISSNNFQTMTQVILEKCPMINPNIAVLSGPSHAEEVVLKLPTVVVVASHNMDMAEKIKNLFSNENFKVSTSSNVLGVEIAGALKNIFAIAFGICHAFPLGDNAKSALFSYGLIEMKHLCLEVTGSSDVIFGLAGVGDLFATCSSKYSRNRLFGEKIGLGISPERAISEIGMVVEGYRAIDIFYFLSKKMNCKTPIIDELYAIIYQNKSIHASLKFLMNRTNIEFE